jgi:D-alanine-D-alanine ligase
MDRAIRIDGNWWKYLFDDLYLLTDARSVCDYDLTCREVTFLEKVLGIHVSSSILDMCGGQGRHSRELARRGYSDITVLDYSSYLIDLGTREARKEKLNVSFIQGDARNTGLSENRFHYIFILASSFGYFPDEGENRKILHEAFRLLKQGGTLLLDLPDRNYVLKNFKAHSSHQIDNDLTVNRIRSLGEDIIVSRETVHSATQGCIRDRSYCVRLYSPEKITGFLQEAGFSSIFFEKDFMCRESQGDYGCMTNRMIVMAKKK